VSMRLMDHPAGRQSGHAEWNRAASSCQKLDQLWVRLRSRLELWLNGAAQESNLPSLGLPDLTGFEGLPSKVQLLTEAGFSLRFRSVGSSWIR
jgi:hypothetical protein